jgi:DNA-binding CsgD family transcriptional regulator
LHHPENPLNHTTRPRQAETRSAERRADLNDRVSDVLERIRSGKESATEQPPPARPARTHVAQTHRLTDQQTQEIFACYRAGTRPRELANRYDITERAIKYLLRKHGPPRQRTRKGCR